MKFSFDGLIGNRAGNFSMVSCEMVRMKSIDRKIKLFIILYMLCLDMGYFEGVFFDFKEISIG
jgi:hypothetical protein